MSIIIRDCRRCGHQDYQHDAGRCCNNLCSQRCNPARAEYGESRTAPSFDRYGNRQAEDFFITVPTT